MRLIRVTSHLGGTSHAFGRRIMRIIAFTGHRPDKLAKYPDIRPQLRAIIEELARDGAIFLSGMALGVDQIAAEEVIKARDAGLPCKLEAVIPFKGQEDYWPSEAQWHYKILVMAADFKTVLADRPKSREQARFLLLRRNTWMVRQADLVVAVWDGSAGGTAHTVREARRNGKPVLRLDPREPDKGWHLEGGEGQT